MPQSLLSLTNKVALVTGDAAGIGKASALILAQAGSDVMIADLNLDAAKHTAEEIKKLTGRNIEYVACNILQDDQLVNAVNKTIETFGHIHILVNNAGGGGRESPDQISVDTIERDFQLNVFAAWRLCQLVAPHMNKAGDGSIINISSMSSINKSPAMSGYASSKAALNHMVANLAHDFGPNIRINAVGPGAIRTAALEKVLKPEIEKTMLSHTPLQRLGEPEDIARAVLFFASPISSWISGQTLFVNGGGVQTLD
ncbi:glucose 1-dehydrogenase [Acinetobacter indicus]|uniref:glucose 1-dehydrogenase n=1 Tax=Acinetobacter indicus TaxID=756892 RepID=UPI0025761C76|nr:glucose 1-dehydrogenase [Acinetobacter indicus]MDM1275789.1 glucose 1-dehydrogenase [Acinetobacter indicus]MDM1301892.1 glucose 1-dehydrogenase [Acinetobacter indicus]